MENIRTADTDLPRHRSRTVQLLTIIASCACLSTVLAIGVCVLIYSKVPSVDEENVNLRNDALVKLFAASNMTDQSIAIKKIVDYCPPSRWAFQGLDGNQITFSHETAPGKIEAIETVEMEWPDGILIRHKLLFNAEQLWFIFFGE